ncbi:AAA family ATPase [Levilactobacillus fujinensis]|uniref:ATP/GTP-binding protein n=1 Tax=Levilactobacillus fujinensis TaxID=2486024 RepID=A0ABW1TFU2_9LACO|nr:AAA family ATPase [Levilactobacillus fujinensis]
MLIDFTLTNFRSFKDSATLSLTATGGTLQRPQKTLTVDNQLSLLKCAAIFGAAGAGKSTLLAGLAVLQRLVVTPTEQIADNLPFDPFRFDEGSKNGQTDFVVNFTRGNRRYRYVLSYDATHVINESLAQTIGTDYEVLFVRENGEITQFPADQAVAVANTRPNMLLLYTLQNWNYGPAIAAFRWFNEDLLVLEKRPNASLVVDDWVISQLMQYLQAVDSEVAGIAQHQVAVQFLDGSAFTRPDLYLIYEKYNEEGEVIGTDELPLQQASLGIQELVTLGLTMIAVQRAPYPQTVLADEFALAVQPIVVEALLELLNSTANRSQLILVSNQPLLIEETLSSDQIFLAEKNYRGESQLLPLTTVTEMPLTRPVDVTGLQVALDPYLLQNKKASVSPFQG